MSDTPSPDIPDPASPTPVGDPAPAAKLRRVITRPDTAIRAPLPGTRVVTRPEADKSSRLPGTYAASYGGDPNWRRGIAVLWVLFGLAAVGELFRALFNVLSGNPGLPFPYEAGRVGTEAAVFVLLWVGWSWLRWLLVAVDFLFGVFFIMTVMAPLPIGPVGTVARSAPALITMPQLALGMIYLISAGYLAFAADVIGFTRHRRETGRGWKVIPVALLVGACAWVVLNVQPLCAALFTRWQPEAGQFATDSLRAIAQSWDVAAYDERADVDYLKVWTKDDQRVPTFGTLTGLGAIQSIPEVKIGEAQSSINRSNSGFLVRYHCDFGKLRCAHGTLANFGCLVSRRLPTGPWRLENLDLVNPHFDPDPATATPAPAPSMPSNLQFNPAMSPAPPPGAQTTPAPH